MASTNLSCLFKVSVLVGMIAGCSNDNDEYKHIYASDNTMDTYGELFAVVEQILPKGMKTLVITSDDVKLPELSYDKANWSALSMGCEITEHTVSRYNDAELFDKTQKAFVQNVWDAAESSDNPFITVGELTGFARDDASAYAEAFSSALFLALRGIEASISLRQLSSSFSGIRSIVTMPTQFTNAEEYAAGYSGLSTNTKSYLNFNVGSKGLILSILGHEIVGHSVSEHSYIPEHGCVAIDQNYIVAAIDGESDSDIAGSIVYDLGVELGVIEDENIPVMTQQLRSIGVFYKNKNRFTFHNSMDLNYYLTNLKVDHDSEGYVSDIDPTNVPLAYTIPLEVNAVADSLAGFMYLRVLKDRLAADPKKYDADERKNINSYSSDLDVFLTKSPKYSKLGQYAKDMGDYEFSHAAMVYMKNNGGFDNMTSWMLSEYIAVLRDLVADYFDAVDALGTDKLKATEIVAEMQLVFGDEVVITLTNLLYERKKPKTVTHTIKSDVTPALK